MTDRFHALTIVLKEDIREDDAEHLIAAILMLKGVLSVQGEVSSVSLLTATHRAKYELRKKVSDLLAQLNDEG